jgi:hypothetical protein
MLKIILILIYFYVIWQNYNYYETAFDELLESVGKKNDVISFLIKYQAILKISSSL